MGLLDGLEKLINEHGSSVILKERITLAEEKYAVLEAENKALRAANEVLKLDKAKLGEQIRNLEDKYNKLAHRPVLSFNQETCTWVDESTSIHYCPKCKATNTLSPMRNESHGWYCSVCATSFNDPSRPKPRTERKPYNWRAGG